MRVEIPDFDQVSTGFEPLPADRLTFQITKCEQRQSKAGNAKLSWELTCQSPGYEGRIIFDDTSLLPQANFAVKAIMNACGAEQDASGFDTEDAIGCNVDAQLTIQSYCKACDKSLPGDVKDCPECGLEMKRSNPVAGYFPASD